MRMRIVVMVVVIKMLILTMRIMTVIRPSREETRSFQVMIVLRMVMVIMFSMKRRRTWALGWGPKMKNHPIFI